MAENDDGLGIVVVDPAYEVTAEPTLSNPTWERTPAGYRLHPTSCPRCGHDAHIVRHVSIFQAVEQETTQVACRCDFQHSSDPTRHGCGWYGAVPFRRNVGTAPA